MYIINTYIVHNSALTSRKSFIENTIKLLKTSPYTIVEEFVEKYDDKTLHEKLSELSSKWTTTIAQQHPTYSKLFDNIHIKQLSKSLNHIECMTKIYEKYESLTDEEKKVNLFLILEDDTIIIDQINDKVQSLIKYITDESNTEFNWDFIFLGIPLTINEDEKTVKHSITDTHHLYRASDYIQIIPSANAYLFNPAQSINMKTQLLELFNNINFMYNTQIMYIINILKLNSYFLSPCILIDGSKICATNSTINYNNVHMYSQEFMEIKKLQTLSDIEYNKDDNIKIYSDAFEKIKQFDTNPDIIYIEAKHLKKLGQYKESLEKFKTAHTLYEKNNANLIKDCDFITDYVDIHKYLND